MNFSTRIYIAYPGTGKSYTAKHHSDVLDYDSKIINPKYNGWEEKYCENIVELAEKGIYDAILVSFNKEVLKILDRQVKYTLVLPDSDVSTKEMIIGRLLLREGGFSHIQWLKRQVEKYDENISIPFELKNVIDIQRINPKNPYLSI